MSRLVFTAAIKHQDRIRNLVFVLDTKAVHISLTSLCLMQSNHHRAAVAALGIVNDLFAAGFDLDGLASAARLSSSNEAEILRSAHEARRAANGSIKSFGIARTC